MKIPNKKQALEYIEFAKKSMQKLNIDPSGYEGHSIYTGKSAKLIGKYYGYDLEVLGLLHDIGRYAPEQFQKRNHTILGYEFMKKEGWDDVAHICLTHAFPIQEVSEPAKEFFFQNKQDIEFVESYLKNTNYTKIDKIIQLCDYISFNKGFVTIEQRFEELKERYGVFSDTEERIQSLYRIKNEIENDINTSIYKVIGLIH